MSRIPDVGFLQRQNPWTDAEKEQRRVYGLDTDQTFPRLEAEICRESKILRDLCNGDRGLYNQLKSELAIVFLDDDPTACAAALIATVRNLFPGQNMSFVDIPVETVAIRAFCAFLVCNRISINATVAVSAVAVSAVAGPVERPMPIAPSLTTTLSPELWETLTKFDAALAEYIESTRINVEVPVDPATVCQLLTATSVEVIAEQTRTAVDFSSYMRDRRFIKGFLEITPSELEAMYRMLEDTFTHIDQSAQPSTARKLYLRGLSTSIKDAPLFRGLDATKDFLIHTVWITAKLIHRNGERIADVIKYDNQPMLQEYMTYVVNKFNVYLREAGRRELDVDAPTPTLCTLMKQEVRLTNVNPQLSIQFGSTMQTLHMIHCNLFNEITNAAMGCSMLVVGESASLPPLISFVRESDNHTEDDEDSEDDEDDEDDEDSEEDEDDSALFPDGKRVGFHFLNAWHNGTIVNRTRRSYNIKDSASGRIVKVLQANVSDDVKGKGRAKPRMVDTSAVDVDGGAGSAASGGAGSASISIQQGDMVEFGKKKGKVNRVGMQCFQVLISDAGERREAVYGYFPVEETSPIAGSQIVHGTRVAWGNRKGEVQGTKTCYEIVKTKKGELAMEYFPENETVKSNKKNQGANKKARKG